MNSGVSLPSKKTGVISVAGIGSVAALFALMDTRYSLASDVEFLVEALQEDRIERIEMVIEDAEEREAYLLSIPEEDRTDYQQQDLLRQENKKEAAIRRLDRDK